MTSRFRMLHGLLRLLAVIGFLIYPLVLPMFFPEFARVGNDSLCLLLAGVTAFLLSIWLNDDRDTLVSLVLGLVLGLGLLAKALFVPVAAALFCFIVLRQFRKGTASHPAAPRNIALIFVPAVFLGGFWYAYSFHVSGSLVVSADSMALAHAGGLTENLVQKFSLMAFLRGLAVPPVSYLWAGSWSLARLPVFLQIPMLVLALLCFTAFILQIRDRAVTDREWLPVWLFGVFAIGILCHVIVSMAAYGHGNTPGWYFHITMPWVAPALGIGVCALLRSARTRTLAVGLLSYAVLFQIMAVWAEFSLFTGCATKADDKSYAFPGHALCLDQLPIMAERLSVLGWPLLAIAGFGGGLICTLLLWRMLRRSAANNRLVVRNQSPTTMTRAGIY